MKLISLVSVGLSALFGGEVSEWDRVADLAAGARVDVVHGALKKAKGRVVAASPEEITVQTDGARVTIPRADVVRVTHFPRSLPKQTLIGMAIGAGGGAALFAVAATASKLDVRRDLVAAGGAVLGSGIGAGVGALTALPKTIYRRP